MSNLASEDLAPSRSFVDANHGDAHWPGRVADAEGHVDVVGAHVLFEDAKVDEDE